MNKNMSIMVDFGSKNDYEKTILDRKSFLEKVSNYILFLGFELQHKKDCTEKNCFTRHSHYTRVKSEGITIWRIQCKRCRAVFSP